MNGLDDGVAVPQPRQADMQHALAVALFRQVPRARRQQILQPDHTHQLSLIASIYHREARLSPDSAMRYTTTRKGSSG